MIWEFIMIQKLKRPLLNPRTDNDRRRELEYGISQADVILYIQMCKDPLLKQPDYMRKILDDDSNWETTKRLILNKELEKSQSTGKKLAKQLRFHGIFRAFLGLLIIAISFFIGFKILDITSWLTILLGIYLLSIGVIRGWYIPKLLRMRNYEYV